MTHTIYFIALIIGKNLLSLGNISYINLILLVALCFYSVTFQKLFSKLFNQGYARFKSQQAKKQVMKL